MAQVGLHQAAQLHFQASRRLRREPLAGVQCQRGGGGGLRGIGLDLQFLLAFDHAQALVDLGDLIGLGTTFDRRQSLFERGDAGQEFLGGGIARIGGVRGHDRETDGERQECALQ